MHSKLPKSSEFSSLVTILKLQAYFYPSMFLLTPSEALLLRLSVFLTKFEILNHHQYGFRPIHYTSMAILELVNNIYEGFEKYEFTIGVFSDLRRVFDTVNLRFILINLIIMVSMAFP